MLTVEKFIGIKYAQCYVFQMLKACWDQNFDKDDQATKIINKFNVLQPAI